MLTKRPSPISILAIAGSLFMATAAPAQAQHEHAGMHAVPESDSAAVASVVHAFHEALQAGDTASVLRLLGADVLVAESGGLENRDEYLSHHLPGDMAFSAAVTREVGPLAVTVSGDVSWAMSTSRTSGTFRDRTVNSVGAELMVLSRDGDAWRIRAIHWSSRPAR